jgi:hypothetical protein
VHPAVLRVRAAAEAMLGPDDFVAYATDTETFGSRNRRLTRPPVGLLAIATPVGSVVMAIDLPEFPAAVVSCLEYAGCEAPPKRYPTK